MRDQLRRRLTYANVMSTIAAFAALTTGGAYAAQKITSQDIARNAVHSKHIKEGQVRTGDLARGSVGKGKIARWAVRTKHVPPGSLRARDLAIWRTAVVGNWISIPPNECVTQLTDPAANTRPTDILLVGNDTRRGVINPPPGIEHRASLVRDGDKLMVQLLVCNHASEVVDLDSSGWRVFGVRL